MVKLGSPLCCGRFFGVLSFVAFVGVVTAALVCQDDDRHSSCRIGGFAAAVLALPLLFLSFICYSCAPHRAEDPPGTL